MSVQLTLLSNFDNELRKRNRSKTIAQSNVITMSKRSWSVAENKILYIIMAQIMEIKQRCNDNSGIDLNSDLIMTFDGKVLLEADNNITRAVETLKNLRDRSIQIYNGKRYTVVGFINYADYDVQTHQVKVQISSKVLPFFFSLTERFTQYALATALECKSIYSQRLFELCAMFAPAGLFSLSLDEYRGIMNAEDKYSKQNLVQRSIKDPQGELRNLYSRELSELFFSFFEKNSSVTFLIHQREEPKRKNSDWAKLIGVILSNVMNYTQADIEDILAQYSIHNSDFDTLFKELANVCIYEKSITKRRLQIGKILFGRGIHPIQTNS